MGPNRRAQERKRAHNLLVRFAFSKKIGPLGTNKASTRSRSMLIMIAWTTVIERHRD
jgi:hypothetical protein